MGAKVLRRSELRVVRGDERRQGTEQSEDTDDSQAGDGEPVLQQAPKRHRPEARRAV